MDLELESGFPPHDGNAPHPRKELSDNDWEGKKYIIRLLYIEQDLALAKVASRMAKEHNFKAR